MKLLGTAAAAKIKPKVKFKANEGRGKKNGFAKTVQIVKGDSVIFLGY